METILLQAQASQGGSGWTSIIMMAAVILIFWLFMIRPQQKREALTTGDRIVTSGGLFGVIRDIKEKEFVVEIADGVRVRVDKGSVFPAADDQGQK